MKNELFVFVILFLTAFLSNCSDNKVIKEDKFIKIYTDLIIAQDTVTSDQKMDSLRTVIFKKYGVDKEQYNATISRYNQDPEKWKKFFDKALTNIESRSTE